MKVLVTGAAGCIGSHVVDRLCADGCSVIGLDSLDQGVHRSVPSYLRTDVDYCFADLRTWTPDERFNDVEAIVHLAALGGVTRAAREPSNVISANSVGTVRLAEYARKLSTLQRFVLISSFSVYGSNYRYRCPNGREIGAHRREEDLKRGIFEVLCPESGEQAHLIPIDEHAVPDPLECYAASKYMQELALRGYGLPVSVLRLSSVYGKRLRLDDGEATIIAKLIGWIGAGKTPQLFEDGGQKRDWVYVGDVVEAVSALLTKKDTPPLVNVCSGIPTTLKDACTLIAKELRVDCKPQVVGGYRVGDMRHCLGDPTRLTQLIGRAPVAFKDGLPKVIGE